MEYGYKRYGCICTGKNKEAGTYDYDRYTTSIMTEYIKRGILSLIRNGGQRPRKEITTMTTAMILTSFLNSERNETALDSEQGFNFIRSYKIRNMLM